MSKPRPLPLLSSHHASLAETVRVLQERRRLLKWLGAAGAVALLPTPSLACTLIPPETEGPYPGDGTNGPNVLTQTGIVRTDIRPSFGASGTAVASGTPMSLTLQLVSTTTGCAPRAGAAVYIWQCDAGGRYSMYSSGAQTQNYLRGVQVSDANGEVTFTTIFPGCYAGRWPHIHFEIYDSLTQATSGHNAARISQLALPEDLCRQVYAQSTLYPGSAQNLNGVSLATDNVFRDDGAAHQMATVSGSNVDGYVGFLEVGVALTAETIFTDSFETA